MLAVLATAVTTCYLPTLRGVSGVVHIPDITHPTFYTTTALQWFRGSCCAPLIYFKRTPPPHLTPSPPPVGVKCDSPADPKRVGPAQSPLNFIGGSGYIVLRGVVDAKDCEVEWGKVMKAWGNGDEKVVNKSFELLFNAGLSEEQAKDPSLPRRWQSKGSLG